MSGNPAFQGSSFQGSAFQSGAMLVAAGYSLGSPVFATPTLTAKNILSVTSYSLQSPVFATPRQVVVNLNANAYSIAPLGFPLTPPALHFNYHLSAATYALASPAFSKPQLLASGNLKPLTAYPYSLASPIPGAPFVHQAQVIHINA